MIRDARDSVTALHGRAMDDGRSSALTGAISPVRSRRSSPRCGTCP
jgi:hypothetical protein